MNRTAKVNIDLSAIAHNYALAKSLVPNQKVMAVIKANAYGHGIHEVTNALSHADGFAVSCVKEAVAVRASHSDARILVLQGAQSLNELQICNEKNLDVTIHQQQHIEWLSHECLAQAQFTVWIKIDTGMHRLGFSPDEVDDVYKKLNSISTVSHIHLMTHFSDADDVNLDKTNQQLCAFASATKNYDGLNSVANSGALLGWQDTHKDWQRLGIALYGVSPFVSNMINLNTKKLKPVMTFTSKVIAINNHVKGSDIGYGGTWRCERDTRVAVVAVGYGEGYPRCASTSNIKGLSFDKKPKQAHVFLNGMRCPVIGRVSMDMMTVDATACEQVAIGDDVELWGGRISVADIAECANTIAYDLLCGVFGRVEYNYTD